MHKIRVFITKVIYGARNGLLMALFIPWGTPHNYLVGRLRAKGVLFLGFRYIKEYRFH